jgi:hypothetical protein
MFENQSQSGSGRLLWKIIPFSVVLFAALAAAVVYLGEGDEAPEQLNGILRSGHSDYEWYSQYVSLESGKIQMGKNFAGHRMVIFSGTIENTGERSLDVIEIRLTLFNYEDSVFETVRTPIKPGGYTPVLGPFASRSFTLYLENLPGSWQASHAEMELNGFRFSTD